MSSMTSAALLTLGAAWALALTAGCVQARAPGSVASLTVLSSRFVATGTASNVVQTVEGGASPSTTATVPIR
jgi:hypothetical protein